MIELLTKIFAHSTKTAEGLTWRIHTTGRAIVYTTHKEKAELKRDQVLAYTRPRTQPHERLKGPLGCYIEPRDGRLTTPGCRQGSAAASAD